MMPLYLCILFLFVMGTTEAASLQTNINQQQLSQKNSVKSQQRINRINDKTTDLVQEYQQKLEQLDTLKVYNQQLEKLSQSQQQQIDLKIQQLDSIDKTEQSIVPLMLQMIETLEKFVSLDVPFLLEERKQRVSYLKEMMNQANITSAEKYRQILQAYAIEMEYGRTIEAWQGTHPTNEQLIVNYLRIGRVALIYQSLDNQSAFFWSKTEQQFQPLAADYWTSLEQGFRVARKQSAPEFIKVPIKTPVQFQAVSGDAND